MWDIVDNRGMNVTMPSVLDVLDKLYCAFNQRADLLPGPEKILYNLSIDFSLFLGTSNRKNDKIVKLHNYDVFCLQLHTERTSSCERYKTN